MSDDVKIRLVVAGDTRAVTETRKAIEQLMAATTKAAGGGPAAQAAKQAAAYAKVQQAAAGVAQAESKKAIAASNAAAADSRAAAAASSKAAADTRAAMAAVNLAAADQRQAAAAAGAIAAHARAEKAALSLAQAQAKAASGANTTASYFSQMGDAVAGSLAGMVGPAAVVTAAIGGIKAAGDLSVVGANADLVSKRFDGLAAAAGTTGQVLLSAMRSASGGEIADMNLQLSGSRAMLLGVADSATEFSTLLSVARDRAQLMGISTTDAFNRLVEGLGKAEPELLDELGIVVNATEANAKYAAQLGVSTAELTKQQRSQALANAVLDQAKSSLATTGGAIQSQAGSYAQLGAATENAKNSLGAFLSSVLEPSAQKLTATAEGVNNLFTWLNNLGAASMDVATRQAAATAATDAYKKVIAEGGTTAQASAAAQQALATAIAGTVPVTQQAAQATVVAMSASEQYAVQARAAAVAGQMKADADRVAAVDAQTAAIADQQLAAQAQAAAQALLAAGPAGANTAAMLANSSTNIDVLTAAYYRLAAAQAAANQAKVNAQAFSDQRAGERDGGSARTAAQVTFDADQDRKRRASEVRRAEEAERLAKRGGGGRVAAAAATGEKLAKIESDTGAKLTEIDAATQDKLVEMDRAAAEKRAQAQRDLMGQIASINADLIASQEANDLELVGADESRKADLIAREQAEAKARIATTEAVAEAQKIAAEGNAELGSKVLDERTKQISAQQSLDEEYAKRSAELAGNPDALAALQQQYDQATQAIADAAAVRIGLAQSAAAQEASAAAAARDEVVSAAEEQKNQIISKAQAAASGITNATGAASSKARSDLKAIGDAVTAIPSQKTITITVQQQGGTEPAGGGKSSSSGNKAAGGGTFMTKGPTTLTVGDNPGGREMVTVTPLSGTGRSHASGNLIALAGGGTIIPAPTEVDSLTQTGILDAAGGAKPAGGGGKGKGSGGGAASTEAAQKAVKEAIELVKAMNELRHVQAEAARLRPAPINMAWVKGLAIESQEIAKIVMAQALPAKKDEVEAFGRYTNVTKDAGDILKTIGELRTMQAQAKKDRPGEINLAYVTGLANEAKAITQIVRDRLIPATELEAELYSSYASAVSDSTSVLKDIADLRKEQAEAIPARGRGLSNRDAWYTALADEAVRVAKIVQARVIPATETERDALSSFADVVGSSVGVLKDVSGLTGEMFADYQSPSDAQLARFAADADRVAQAMTKAAAKYDSKGLEAAKAYTDALGGTFGVIKDGLLAFDAINSGDFVLDGAKLEQFSKASMLALDTTRALAVQAAQIPASDIAALQGATAAVSGLAESSIKMAAVPFGNLSSGVGGGGGGGGGITIMPGAIQVNAVPGMDVNAVANQVIDKLSTRVAARR